MRRRILGTLLWFLLLPIVGAGRLCWTLLRLLGSIRPKTLFMLGGLAVALSAPSPVSSQISEAVWPAGQMLQSSGLVVLGVVVLSHGMGSPAMRRLWRKIQQHRSHGPRTVTSW